MSRIKNSRALKVCLGLAYLAIFANCASAATAEHGGEHHASFADIIPYWVNFGLYVLILWKLLAKPVLKSWSARIKQIEEAVNKGERAREEALEQLETAKSRRLALTQMRKELEDEILHQQEHECLEIINDGVERASRTTAQSQDMLRAEQKSFEASLRSELAQKVLARAREMLTQKVDAQSDKRLREDAKQGIAELLN